jgi:hypothetical protein
MGRDAPDGHPTRYRSDFPNSLPDGSSRKTFSASGTSARTASYAAKTFPGDRG